MCKKLKAVSSDGAALLYRTFAEERKVDGAWDNLQSVMYRNDGPLKSHCSFGDCHLCRGAEKSGEDGSREAYEGVRTRTAITVNKKVRSTK